MYGLRAVAAASVLSAYCSFRWRFASIPSTHFSERSLDAAARLQGVPAWRLLGANAQRPIECNATLAAAPPAAVAERAGPFWSGRALAVQNTAQFLTDAAVPPVAGLTVAGLGYPAMFALAAVFPLAALGLVPVRDERALS